MKSKSKQRQTTDKYRENYTRIFRKANKEDNGKPKSTYTGK